MGGSASTMRASTRSARGLPPKSMHQHTTSTQEMAIVASLIVAFPAIVSGYAWRRGQDVATLPILRAGPPPCDARRRTRAARWWAFEPGGAGSLAVQGHARLSARVRLHEWTLCPGAGDLRRSMRDPNQRIELQPVWERRLRSRRSLRRPLSNALEGRKLRVLERGRVWTRDGLRQRVPMAYRRWPLPLLRRRCLRAENAVRASLHLTPRRWHLLDLRRGLLRTPGDLHAQLPEPLR